VAAYFSHFVTRFVTQHRCQVYIVSNFLGFFVTFFVTQPHLAGLILLPALLLILLLDLLHAPVSMFSIY